MLEYVWLYIVWSLCSFSMMTVQAGKMTLQAYGSSSKTTPWICGIFLTCLLSWHTYLGLYSGSFLLPFVARVSTHLELYSLLTTWCFSSAFCTCLLYTRSWDRSLLWLVEWWDFFLVLSTYNTIMRSYWLNWKPRQTRRTENDNMDETSKSKNTIYLWLVLNAKKWKKDDRLY